MEEKTYTDGLIEGRRAGKEAMLEQIKKDCCSICDNEGYCFEGGRTYDCTIGMYIYWLEEKNDPDDYAEYYKYVLHCGGDIDDFYEEQKERRKWENERTH